MQDCPQNGQIHVKGYKKMIFSIENVVGKVRELLAKLLFKNGQVLNELLGLKTLFLLFNI